MAPVPSVVQSVVQSVHGSGIGTGTGYSLVLYRHYDPPRDKNGDVAAGAKRMNQYSEAVLHHVLSMENIPSLLMAMNGEWILHREGKRIKLCSDVYLTISRSERNDWDVSALELTLTSARKTATQLVRYVDQLLDAYQSHINNELGTKIYLFDQKERNDYRGNPYEGTMCVQAQKKYDIMNAPKHLSFQQLPFLSNKSFDNLVGPEVDVIRERVQHFVHNREWYDSKGIPYQLGFLLSGESGTGKSSIIRAIANYTRRHVFNVNFANIKTVTQLKALFYKPVVNVLQDGANDDSVDLNVPIEQRVIVMEEIDALGNTIMERRGWDTANGGGGASDNQKTVHDEITLGDLLQVLDGIMESPGRIVIITSNRPDVLDEALVRPGRIDVPVKFGFASRDTTSRMFTKLYDRNIRDDLAAGFPDGVLSPADVMEVMFRSFGKPNPDEAVAQTLSRRAEEVQHERQHRMQCIKEHLADMARRAAARGDDETEETEMMTMSRGRGDGVTGGGGAVDAGSVMPMGA